MLLKGADLFLRERRTRALKDALTQAFGGLDVALFDGERVSAADVLDECRSMGLLSGHKLVILDAAEHAIRESTRPLFERFVSDPPEGSTLLLRAGTWRPGKLDAMIEANGTILDCSPPPPEAVHRWILSSAAQRHHVAISPEIAEELTRRAGFDLARLDTEIAKLAAAAGGSIDPATPPAPITAELIRQYVGLSREESAWALQASLLENPPSRTVRQLRYLLDVVGEPPARISWGLLDLARKLHAARAGLATGANQDALAASLKLWGPSKLSVLAAARKLSQPRARALLRACVEGDVAQKSSLGEVEHQLERMVLAFSELQNSPGSPAVPPRRY